MPPRERLYPGGPGRRSRNSNIRVRDAISPRSGAVSKALTLSSTLSRWRAACAPPSDPSFRSRHLKQQSAYCGSSDGHGRVRQTFFTGTTVPRLWRDGYRAVFNVANFDELLHTRNSRDGMRYTGFTRCSDHSLLLVLFFSACLRNSVCASEGRRL